jgi:hypothetical protein
MSWESLSLNLTVTEEKMGGKKGRIEGKNRRGGKKGRS